LIFDFWARASSGKQHMCSYSEGCVLSHDKSGVGMVICSVGLRSGDNVFFFKKIFLILVHQNNLKIYKKNNLK
jgi:hypothetical protein